MFNLIRRYATPAFSLFASAVFLDSLRYKFTNHPNTQEIFGRLNDWAASLGAGGLFAQTGLFSQYVIGTAELLASSLLLIGIWPRFRRIHALGALIAFAVMSGAVSFHLFTPLGVDPNNDGGGLFAAALTIWATSLGLLIVRRNELIAVAREIAAVLVPPSAQQQAQRSATPARA
ncbi:MAG: hypothetical protein AB7J28_04065 [Hyphomonadaceae bacterium]